MYFLKNKISLLALFLILYSCSSSSEKTHFEIWEEPNHQVVLSKDNFKVMDVLISGGDITSFFTQEDPTIFVLINGVSYAIQEPEKEWKEFTKLDEVLPGTLQDMSKLLNNSDPMIKQRIRVTDEETYHLIAISNTGKGEALRSSIMPAKDTIINPIDSTLMVRDLMNTAWFKEHRYVVAAGQQSNRIQTEYQAVLVQYTKGLTSIIQNDIEFGFKSEKGAFSYHLPNTPFQIANKTTTDQEFVLIEIK
jgi:hypothetical protein